MLSGKDACCATSYCHLVIKITFQLIGVESLSFLVLNGYIVSKLLFVYGLFETASKLDFLLLLGDWNEITDVGF
jgi:hypothetical protein